MQVVVYPGLLFLSVSALAGQKLDRALVWGRDVSLTQLDPAQVGVKFAVRSEVWLGSGYEDRGCSWCYAFPNSAGTPLASEQMHLCTMDPLCGLRF